VANHPNPSDWKKEEELTYSGSRGWDITRRLPVILSKHYPWLEEFEFGFPIEEDIPEYRHLGWVHLRREHFAADDFNNAVALRYALDDDGGNLRWREHYIMIAPWDHRKRIQVQRNADHEKTFTRAISGGIKDQPEHLEVLPESGFEEQHIKLAPPPVGAEEAPDLEDIPVEEVPNKRGRPKKNT
jgi:hypothetical protein